MSAHSEHKLPSKSSRRAAEKNVPWPVSRRATSVAEFGKLEVLVNNAAFQEHAYDFEQLTNHHFDRTIRANLYGYFYMAKAVR